MYEFILFPMWLLYNFYIYYLQYLTYLEYLILHEFFKHKSHKACYVDEIVKTY